jgi:hypothetical protein
MEVGGKLHDPAVLSPGKFLGILLIGDWMGPRASLDAVVKRKIPSSCWDSNPPIIQPVAQRYTAELSPLLTYLRIKQ